MIKKELQQELNRTKLVLDYARQEIEEKDKEIKRLNNIIDKAKEKSIYLQERYGYILDDLTFMLMQGSDKE